MTEERSETTGLKVINVGRDGKRNFDRQTKQRLVEACLEPSASVAGLALKHGVNANLLRKWIKLHQQRLAGTPLQPAPPAVPRLRRLRRLRLITTGQDECRYTGRTHCRPPDCTRIREGTSAHPRSKDVVARDDFGAVDSADAQRRHTQV
jgi:transposase